MRWLSVRNRKLLAVVVMTTALAGVVWLQGVPLLTWYYLRQLASTGGANRNSWVERVAGLDRAAVPGLLGLLEREDARACGNAQAALARLTQRWPPDDGRWTELADRLAESFPRQSAAGKECTLQQTTEWLRLEQGRPPAALPRCADHLLAEALRGTDTDLEGPVLELANALLDLPGPAPAVTVRCRELARKGLASSDAENRVRATRLAAHPGMDLLAQVIALLSDPLPEVRRAAMLAVGPVAEALPTDNLLPWLHDPDADVRRLCEAALLARADFQPEHLHLARLITAPQAAVRLQVLRHLQQDSTLELGIWLRRLSHDPAPEVRAAAIRAAASQRVIDLRDLIEQRAQSDPSPTVCQLARYYLRHPKPR